MYELKPTQPAFEQISGPKAGRRFEHGRQYEEIPSESKDRFQKVKTKTTKPAAKPAAKEGDK
jgi:hypothetical protein